MSLSIESIDVVVSIIVVAIATAIGATAGRTTSAQFRYRGNGTSVIVAVEYTEDVDLVNFCGITSIGSSNSSKAGCGGH